MCLFSIPSGGMKQNKKKQLYLHTISHDVWAGGSLHWIYTVYSMTYPIIALHTYIQICQTFQAPILTMGEVWLKDEEGIGGYIMHMLRHRFDS